MEEVELKRRAKERAKVLAAQQRQRECDTMVEIQLVSKALPVLSCVRMKPLLPYNVTHHQRERAERKRQAAAVDRAVVRHQVAEDRVARRKEQLAEEARVARNLQHQAELLEQIANKDARQRIVSSHAFATQCLLRRPLLLPLLLLTPEFVAPQVVNEKYEQRKQVMLEARIERELLEKMKVEAIRKLEREQGIDPKWAQDILKVSVVLK